MPGHPRITIRLTPALEALVSDHVRQGSRVSDIVREALEAYLGACPTPRQTQATAASASASVLSDTLMDTVSDVVSAHVSDMSARLSAMVSDVSDIRERLGQLEARLAGLSDTGRQPRPHRRNQPPPAGDRPTRPAPLEAYDGDRAYARMQALQAQGRSLAQIAAQLTAEGLRTRHGKAWHKSTVAYVLKTHGR